MIKIKKIKNWYNAAYGRRTLHVGNVVSKKHILLVLHELGHHVNRHDGASTYSEQKLRREIDAWVYALSCIRQEFQTEAKAFALEALETYNFRGDTKHITGFYFNPNEIEQLLQKKIGGEEGTM